MMATTRVYVSGTSWMTGRKELVKYFQQFGPVAKANVVFDKDTGMSRGHGFVHFENADSVQAVLQDRSHSIDGKRINVKSETR